MSFRLRVWLLCLLALAPPVYGEEVVPPGTQPKAGAGAGQTLSRGSTALFYNPANLIYGKFIEPFIDVGYAMVNYRFLHPDVQFDEVVIPVATPFGSAGVSIRPVPGFSVGAAILPLGLGDVQRVEKVPLEIVPGTTQLTNVENSQTAYKIAAGAAGRFAGIFSFGGGVIRTRDVRALRVYDAKAGTDANPFLDAQYAATTYQFSGGVRAELFDRAFVIAASYRSGVTLEYQGDILHPASNNQFVVYEGRGYLPQVFGGGLEARFGNFGGFVDITYETHSAGRLVVRRGLPTDPLEVDLIDTFNFVVGGKLWLFESKHQLIAAGGYYPAYVGDGQSPTGNNADPFTNGSIAGVEFGDLEAITRTVFSGGYRAKITGHGYFQGGASYATGSRAVPNGFPGQGDYAVSVILVNAGLAFGF
jgi:hypothetical protein